MRLVRDVVASVTLGAAVWLVIGLAAGRAQYGVGELLYGSSLVDPGYWHIRPDRALDGAIAFGLFLLAGLLFSVLLFAPVSPAGPRFAGLLLAVVGLWPLVDVYNYEHVLPRDPFGVRDAAHAPGWGYALLVGLALLMRGVRPEFSWPARPRSSRPLSVVLVAVALTAALGQGLHWLSETVGVVHFGDGIYLRYQINKPSGPIDQHIVSAIVCTASFAAASLLFVAPPPRGPDEPRPGRGKHRVPGAHWVGPAAAGSAHRPARVRRPAGLHRHRWPRLGLRDAGRPSLARGRLLARQRRQVGNGADGAPRRVIEVQPEPLGRRAV